MARQRGAFTLQFWMLVGATFLGFLGIGAVLPALGPHVKLDLGGTDRTVGFVIGIFSFMALMSRFFSGPLADRRGRKITFQIGLASCALAGAAYFLPLALPGAYLGRILQGFGEACLYTGAAAWAVEVAGVERSAQALGYVSSAIWGGVSAGPALGHWLGSFQHAAAFQVVAATCGFALAWFVREHFKPATHRKPQLKPQRLLMPGLAIGFTNVHYPVITGFLILHLASHGGSGPAAFSAYAITILCSRFFLGGLPDRIHPGITFYGGLATMAVGLALLASGPPPTVAIASAALLGLGFSFPWSSLASVVLRRTDPSEHGSTIGMLSAFFDLFVGMSSVAAGAVSFRFGYPTAFLMAAVALIAAGLAARSVFFPRTPEAQRAVDEVREEEECCEPAPG